MKKVSYRGLFNKYQDTTILSRVEQYAKWTLPYLGVDSKEITQQGRVIVERDFQDIGALYTNNLASKLVRLLFPTQYPFFQAGASKVFKEQARMRGVDDADIQAALSQLEMRANKRLFINSGYSALILAVKCLIVTGNVLLHRNSDTGSMTAYTMHNYGCRRSGDGRLLDLVLREVTVVEALPQELQDAIKVSSGGKYSKPEATVEVYTRVKYEPLNGEPGYRVTQQVDTTDVGAGSWHPTALCPWMAATWSLVAGAHYGTGMVEDYAGGFAKLSALSEAATLYSVETMRVVHLVGPAAGSDTDAIMDAESGDYVRGDPDNIRAHEAGDGRKLEAVEAQIAAVAARLARAFMYQGGTRDAERVTAYELQRDAQEAEYALGGVYSTLSAGLQVPLAHILMTEVSGEVLPGIISGELRPDVTAGIPALGRSSDVQNLLLAAQEMGGIVPVTQLDKRINPSKLVDIVLAGRSIDPSTVFYTQEEQRANAEAEQASEQAQMAMLQANTLADQSQNIQQTLQGA